MTEAFDDPRISDPSTYTELHDDDTCNKIVNYFHDTINF